MLTHVTLWQIDHLLVRVIVEIHVKYSAVQKDRTVYNFNMILVGTILMLSISFGTSGSETSVA